MGKNRPEVKTEEGFSADIYPWRCMPAQCPHYVRTSHEGYMTHEEDVVRTLCGHISPELYMSALYPSSVFTSSNEIVLLILCFLGLESCSCFWVHRTETRTLSNFSLDSAALRVYLFKTHIREE